MVDFFGSHQPLVPMMKDLTLPKHPGRVLAKTKLISLAKKYFSIPVKFRSFYPKELPKEAKKLSKSAKKKIKKRKKSEINTKVRVVRRKVGRPKKLPPIGKGIVSVASFFRSTKVLSHKGLD